MKRTIASMAALGVLASGCQPEPIGVAHLAIGPAGRAAAIAYATCPGERVTGVEVFETLSDGDEVPWVVTRRGPSSYIASRHYPGGAPSPAERYADSLPALDDAQLTVIVQSSRFGQIGLSSIEFGDLFDLGDEVYVADGNVKRPETFRADAEYNC